jgi:DNA processing protein
MPVGSEYRIEDILGPLNDVERKYAPERLHAAGNVELLRGTIRVSIVGTRTPTPVGSKRAARLARELAVQEVVVVSGLARGIDREAHVRTIESGGRTIAVIGTPLDRAYPSEHAELQARIAREHLVVSQFAPGFAGGSWVFPARNRTMALLSHATVIVEGGKKSGVISQGWEALRLGRPLFLLKSLVETPGLEWPHQLIQYGARTLVDTLDLLDALPARASAAEVDAF